MATQIEIRIAAIRSVRALLFMAMLLLSACGWYGDHTLNWKEDVLLEDGTRLQIKRHVEFTDHNSLAGDSYGAVESEATLQLLGEFSPVPVWSAPLMPLLLYRTAGNEWVVVAASTSCEVWRSLGRPNPPYWEYRIIDGVWRQTALAQESIGKAANLFFNYHAGIRQSPVTMQIKQKDWDDPMIGKKYLQIVASIPIEYCGG